MAKEWQYGENNKTIILSEPPKTFKYLTGTRLAGILGLNPYTTPFQIWCECTRLVTPPYEETIYTKAGRIIEPIQREYVSKKFPNIVSPEEYFGEIFEQVRWNFFRDEDKPFAGCWDAVGTKDNGKDIAMVVEFKTASDATKWSNNQIPVYYELQGALYAKLLGLDRVLFVASFLDKIDYAHPEQFVPSEENTIMVVKKLKDIVIELDGALLSIDEVLEKAKELWNTYIKTGISLPFDEKKDKEYLDIIRASQPINDDSLEELCDRAVALEEEIENKKEELGINELEKTLKPLKDNIKKGLMDSLQDGETSTSCGSYKLTGSVKKKFNEKEFAKYHPDAYESFCEESIEYRLGKVKVEEND